MKDHFANKADNWDKGDIRKSTPFAIAEAIKKRIILNKTMKIMDFGVGTGLLGFEIAKEVQKVFGVDMSPSMLKKLEEKNTPELSIKAVCQDIVKEPLKQKFDGIVSSMTLHHVEDLKAFFISIKKNLNNGGFIAIADLEEEDGTFHSDNAGVFHFGFKEQELFDIIKECGFKEIIFENITTINKPQRDFGVFLLTAKV